MSAPALPTTAAPPGGWFYRLSVDDYHRMIEIGVLRSDSQVELLDGYLVRKMPKNPTHPTALQRTRKRIEARIAQGWTVRIQDPITLATSEPEPDVAVARGSDDDYETRHPGPTDLGLVVEVSDTTLATDRNWKRDIYEAAGLVVYWIVDLLHRQVEVYTLTGGTYGPPVVLTPGQHLPLVLDGVHLGTIPVADLFS